MRLVISAGLLVMRVDQVYLRNINRARCCQALLYFAACRVLQEPLRRCMAPYAIVPVWRTLSRN